jgi:hypothetical protein
MMKIEGSGSASGSGSISQRYASADPDPDPHQNVMDPQHWPLVHTDSFADLLFFIFRRISAICFPDKIENTNSRKDKRVESNSLDTKEYRTVLALECLKS